MNIYGKCRIRLKLTDSGKYHSLAEKRIGYIERRNIANISSLDYILNPKIDNYAIPFVADTHNSVTN